MKTATKKEPELLVNDSDGIYIFQTFLKVYSDYILNKDELKEDIEIGLTGPDHEHYWDAWDNVLNNCQFTNDKNEKYTVGNIGESGDLWAIPEGYEFPED